MNTNIEVSLHPLLSTIPDIQRTHTLKSTYYLVNYGQNHAQADNLPCLQLWTDCIGVVCSHPLLLSLTFFCLTPLDRANWDGQFDVNSTLVFAVLPSILYCHVQLCQMIRCELNSKYLIQSTESKKNPDLQFRYSLIANFSLIHHPTYVSLVH